MTKGCLEDHSQAVWACDHLRVALIPDQKGSDNFLEEICQKLEIWLRQGQSRIEQLGVLGLSRELMEASKEEKVTGAVSLSLATHLIIVSLLVTSRSRDRWRRWHHGLGRFIPRSLHISEESSCLTHSQEEP